MLARGSEVAADRATKSQWAACERPEQGNGLVAGLPRREGQFDARGIDTSAGGIAGGWQIELRDWITDDQRRVVSRLLLDDNNVGLGRSSSPPVGHFERHAFRAYLGCDRRPADETGAGVNGHSCRPTHEGKGQRVIIRVRGCGGVSIRCVDAHHHDGA